MKCVFSLDKQTDNGDSGFGLLAVVDTMFKDEVYLYFTITVLIAKYKLVTGTSWNFQFFFKP